MFEHYTYVGDISVEFSTIHHYTLNSETVPLVLNLTGCSLLTENATAKRKGSTTLTFTPNSNYQLPTSVQVTGATAISWNHDTGVLVIENPTTDSVTIKIIATKLPHIIAAGTRHIKASPTMADVSANFAFTTNGVAGTAITVDSTGITYELAAPIGATKVYTAATGHWTLDEYQAFTLATDTIVSDEFYAWYIENHQATPEKT